MAGLLDDVLPYIYSRSNALQRQLGGLLSDPVGSFEQTAGLLQDKDREQRNLLSQAFADQREPFKVTDQKAMSQAATNMLLGPLGFSPVGMTKAANIHEPTGLPLNPDGTVTVYHHTNKAAAEAIQRQKSIKSAGEPSVYFTTEKNPVTGYGDTVVPVNINPKLLRLDDEFPNGRLDFSVDVKKPGGSFRY